MTLTAPFPYFGGKRRVAAMVWDRFGPVVNYVEPFFGSGAVLLARPDYVPGDPPRETVNDADALVCNFWRAVKADPVRIADLCDWPVNECDLEARHKAIVRRARELRLETRCKNDESFFDPEIAGWWCWGLGQWIGGGWCAAYHGDTAAQEAPGDGESEARGPRPEARGSGGRRHGRAPEKFCDRGVHRRIETVSGHQGFAGSSPGEVAQPDAGLGVSAGQTWRTRPLIDKDNGVHVKRTDVSADRATGRGVASALSCVRPKIPLIDARGGKGVSGEDLGHGPRHRAALIDWMGALSERLRRVKVVCGDWSRITSPTATHLGGLCGVFLDPPYATEAGRDMDIYRKDCGSVAHDVRAWAIEAGKNPLMRIALCGYEGEHAMPDTWECVSWRTQGGYGNQKKKGENVNAGRERIWLSPHCLRPSEMLFGGEA